MEFYLRDMNWNRIEMNADQGVTGGVSVTHDCPFCSGKASTNRSLVWIISQIAAKGSALSVCPDCVRHVTWPGEMLADGCLQRLADCVTIPDFANEIATMRPRDLLIPDWGEAILEANRSGPVDLYSLKWDGKGPCPGCGKAGAEQLSQGLQCVRCSSEFWVNSQSISHVADTMIRCSRCGMQMTLPKSVWCPVCDRNLQNPSVIQKLFQETNRV